MITLRFWHEDGMITGFECSGHSGYAKKGYDIVCAAITTAVTLAECAINDVRKVGAAVMRNDEKATIALRLPQMTNKEDRDACETVLKALYLTVSMLSEEYSAYLRVI